MNTMLGDGNDPTRPAVSIMTHEDGTVSVGFSGNKKSDEAFALQLQNKLNKGLKDPKYIVSGTSMPTDELTKSLTGNKPGECAEAKVVNAANKNTSKITGYEIIWRTELNSENPQSYKPSDEGYEVVNSDGAPVESNQMKPCDT